jgi:hypothetical protein
MSYLECKHDADRGKLEVKTILADDHPKVVMTSPTLDILNIPSLDS